MFRGIYSIGVEWGICPRSNGMVGVNDSDEKERILILGIYQLDETLIATQVSIGRRL